MIIEDLEVHSNLEIAKNTFLVKTYSSKLSSIVQPGQFCNLKVTKTQTPLLRRPFSVSDVEGDYISFMYKVVGVGTEILSKKKRGDIINALAPLGNSFNIDDNFEHAILIGGGIGIAPFPYLIKNLKGKKDFSVLFGVRSEGETHQFGLENISYSSDDGTIGIKGNVIDLLINELQKINNKKVKIFACGPTPMLKGLQIYCAENNLDGEVSLESQMACGFGICQGCPVETKEQEAYKLICKDGPVFNIKDVVL
ncbi:MAG: dihydroorotate dehydrogenase electron transfer subunit [Ignavibacteriae bacterium]|nr:dihydroorotate dehydrogenase electron transfer subunit [Ignavibacteriota bacterium]